MSCNICKKEYSPNCDYNQGRCPHHRPLITNPYPLWLIILFVAVVLFYSTGNNYGF